MKKEEVIAGKVVYQISDVSLKVSISNIDTLEIVSSELNDQGDVQVISVVRRGSGWVHLGFEINVPLDKLLTLDEFAEKCEGAFKSRKPVSQTYDFGNFDKW